MNLGNLLFEVPQDLRSTIRKLENLERKIISAKWSLIFNKSCLKENILPAYTRIRHHDPAVSKTSTTKDYRRYLMEREVKLTAENIEKCHSQRDELYKQIREFECLEESKNLVMSNLRDILVNSDKVQKIKTIKKLNSLYGGQMYFKDNSDQYVNLSNYVLSQDEKDYLNLGLNYHIQPKYDKLHKVTEIEILYDRLKELEKNKIIDINPNITAQLVSEGNKHRNPKYYSKIPPKLREAGKNLRNNTDIVIRRADKSSIYVILNRDEYICKIDDILSDSSKFLKISKDPTEKLKSEANNLISTLNARQDSVKIAEIKGDFSPGYMYGNPKIHKENNPLRPIISQVSMPTYNLAKSLNTIINPYMPNKFSLKSTADFVDLIHSKQCDGILASLDVENLFTNVPIDKTIDVIVEYAYNHPNIPPPKIPENILRNLLELCTKKAPFTSPTGEIFIQIEGIGMGSPLGPTFANFYMGFLEDKFLDKMLNKPSIYARYVDDIFVEVKDFAQLLELKELYQNNSVLSFTYELNVNNKLPFLDVMVESTDGDFNTSVYHKPTSHGTCLNADSECVDRYKNSVVNNYLHRAYKVNKNWTDFHNEIEHIKQMLVNNNYSNTRVDKLIAKFIESKVVFNSQAEENVMVPVYYHSQMHDNYKIEERVLRGIVHDNITCIDKNKKINLTIYYKDKKSSNLLMINNLSSKTSPLDQTNVVYNFSCPHCKVASYVGMTTKTLMNRLISHTNSGSIKEHFRTIHNEKLTRNTIFDNTTILARAQNRNALYIKEALLIAYHNPSINKQYGNFTNILKIYSHSKPNLKETNKLKCTNSRVPPFFQSNNVPIDYNIENEKNTFAYRDNLAVLGMPNMEEVLLNFGIKTHNFIEIPIENYQWKKFSVCDSPRDTISKRIKSLRRGVTCHNNK